MPVEQWAVDQRDNIKSSVNREVLDVLVAAARTDPRYTLVRGPAGKALEVQYRFNIKPSGARAIAVRTNSIKPFRCYLPVLADPAVKAFWSAHGMWTSPHQDHVVLVINSAEQATLFLNHAVEEQARLMQATFGTTGSLLA